MSSRCRRRIGTKCRQTIQLLHNLYTRHVSRLGNTSHGATYLLKLVLAFLEIQVTPYARILSRELDNLFPIEIVNQSRVDFARKLVDVKALVCTHAMSCLSHLVEEVIQKLDIDKHRGCMRQFVSDDVQEYFWAEDIAPRASLATLRFQRRKT